ncbi:MAG: DNA polymerase III subunit alpha [Endomicrobium sp.]|jgi:DNA polymerase-3 subunit alpha|nr:DNA polymerase III subunit alpha [Endomicrobium sp.]
MVAEFVHLHNHTEYSLLDGACRITNDRGDPSELFDLIAKEYKMPALAITDHGNMYGAIEFYQSAKKSGIKPIVGCEVYVAPKSRFDKSDVRKKNGENYNHLTLIAKDFKGYQNLMKIVSVGFTEGFYYRPRVDKEILRKYNSGLITFSGCLAGEVASYLIKGNFEKAQGVAIEYRDIFGKDNFYIEIMDNGLEDQRRVIPDLIKLSKKTAIPLVATNDCHFLRKEDYQIHDILLCVGIGKILDDSKRLRFDSDLFCYRSAEDMQKTFSYAPEAIKNTLEITEKVNVEIAMDKFLLPLFPVPKGYKSDYEYLETLCRKGLVLRYGGEIEKEQEDRLNHELSVINKMGFASYFLIVSDFIKYAKDHGIPVGPGRGSGTGAMIAYTLGITDICPLKYGLLFERFLNTDRCSMPDLDIDFADSGRDEVINYVRQKYGEKKCAQIITFGAMQSRLVIRDVARVMGFTPAESNRIAKLITQNANVSEALKHSKELLSLVESDEKIANLITASRKLEGLKRHTGIHAAGMVIANEEITNYSPLAKGSKDILTTQYDGSILPQLGLLKIDFLGLRVLTVIDECVKFIKKKNSSFNLDCISLNDKKTYELLSEAKTMGVFQLESRGMRGLIKKLKPNRIEDIIALVALYRPGPMGSGMLDDFVNRKHGKTKIVFDHPLQKPILEDTYGVILYQEQVMKMSETLAGFTPGEADNLRKAMSKKKTEVIKKEKEKFINGAKKNCVDRGTAEKIFNNIVAFAGYGFNKSHSAAYSLISYRTAYLKANYPLEYFTALLSSEIGRSVMKNDEENKLAMYLDDMSVIGIKLLPPDVQCSDGKFKIESSGIRFGLLAVKNVGESVTNSIERARLDGTQIKKFKNWNDFLQRVDLNSINKKAIESLVKAGAFDSLSLYDSSKLTARADLLKNIDSSIDEAAKIKRDRKSAQGFLFDTADGIEMMNVPSLRKGNSETFEPFKALEFEKEVLGFYLSGHPLIDKKEELSAYSDFRLDKLALLEKGTDLEICVAGMIVIIKKLISRTRKELYAKFKLEDLYGTIDAVLFPRNFKKFGGYLKPNNIVVVKGKLADGQGQIELLVEEVMTIDEAKCKFSSKCKQIHIKLSTSRYDEPLCKKLKKIFEKYKGKSKVYIDLEDALDGRFSLETEYLANCSDDFIKDVEMAIGTAYSVELR